MWTLSGNLPRAPVGPAEGLYHRNIDCFHARNLPKLDSSQSGTSHWWCHSKHFRVYFNLLTAITSIFLVQWSPFNPSDVGSIRGEKHYISTYAWVTGDWDHCLCIHGTTTRRMWRTAPEDCPGGSDTFIFLPCFTHQMIDWFFGWCPLCWISQDSLHLTHCQHHRHCNSWWSLCLLGPSACKDIPQRHSFNSNWWWGHRTQKPIFDLFFGISCNKGKAGTTKGCL